MNNESRNYLADENSSEVVLPTVRDNENKCPILSGTGVTKSQSTENVSPICDDLEITADTGVDSRSVGKDQQEGKGNSLLTEDFQHQLQPDLLPQGSDSAGLKRHDNEYQNKATASVEKRVWSPKDKMSDSEGSQRPQSPNPSGSIRRHGYYLKVKPKPGSSWTQETQVEQTPEGTRMQAESTLGSACTQDEPNPGSICTVVESKPAGTWSQIETNPGSTCSQVEQTPGSTYPQAEPNPASNCSQVEQTPGSTYPQAEPNPASNYSQVEQTPGSTYPQAEPNPESNCSQAEQTPGSTCNQVTLLEPTYEDSSPQCKLYNVARELLKTEHDYVQRLNLLHQVFYCQIDQENRQQSFLPLDALNQMFSNIESIHQFHHECLLQQLESRMQNWNSEQKIGDLMKRCAPFLKLYTEYIQNFNKAMNLINHWLNRSPKFAAVIKKIQEMPECGNLSLQHHMLEPIQRLPRYELLIKKYLDHLPEDSPDRQDTLDALALVTSAARHSNEAIRSNEKFQKLLDIYQKLRGVRMDFISPTREFVKEGPITKISARSGEKQSRYLFLFNDLLLICTESLVGGYKVRIDLAVNGMEVQQRNMSNIPGTFIVYSKQKVVEFLDEYSAGKSPTWFTVLTQIIQDYHNRNQSNCSKSECNEPTAADEQLGSRAPRWIRDDASPSCMMCQEAFTRIFRRHHCRACGKLICKTCSKMAPLAYLNHKVGRVCLFCYNIIMNYAKQRQGKTVTSDEEQKEDIVQGEPSRSPEHHVTDATFYVLSPVTTRSSPIPCDTRASQSHASSPESSDLSDSGSWGSFSSCSSDFLEDEHPYVNMPLVQDADEHAYENLPLAKDTEGHADKTDSSGSDAENEFSDGSEDAELEIGPSTVLSEQTSENTTPGCKLSEIAEELLRTERIYVGRLTLLHQVFCRRIDEEIRRMGFLPGDVLIQMFSSIQSIHQFHEDFLLRELESRMENWNSNKRIGDLMKSYVPYLKLYADYVTNFDNAITLISQWLDKFPQFAALVKEIQQMPECGNLSLQHHMLEPLHRVSHYKHLLKEYLKHLPEDSPDRQDVEDAFDLVAKAASHCTRANKSNLMNQQATVTATTEAKTSDSQQ